MKRSLLRQRSAVSILLLIIGFILNGQTVIFNENFSGFTSGSHLSPSTSDVSGVLDSRTQSPGWTGSKIYSAGGEIKIGTADITGWIETPLIDFSGNDESILLKFDISRWPGIQSTVQVSIDGSLLGNSISPSDEYITVELPVTPGLTSGKIKFESLSKRFFLDNIIVTSNINTSAQTVTDGLITVRAFPNPAKDVITFSNLEPYRLVEISDINGVNRKTIKSDGTDVLEVSLADFQPGIYFARFYSDKGSLVCKIIRCN
jgi:hypothetical protein